MKKIIMLFIVNNVHPERRISMNLATELIAHDVYVKNDARREFKWKEFIETILETPIGQSQTIICDTEREAKNAQTTIRDDINLRLEKYFVRTRCKRDNETGKWKVVFTRLQDRSA
jgi:hypothetical protein